MTGKHKLVLTIVFFLLAVGYAYAQEPDPPPTRPNPPPDRPIVPIISPISPLKVYEVFLPVIGK